MNDRFAPEDPPERSGVQLRLIMMASAGLLAGLGLLVVVLQGGSLEDRLMNTPTTTESTST